MNLKFHKLLFISQNYVGIVFIKNKPTYNMISDVESIILFKRTICSPSSSPHSYKKKVTLHVPSALSSLRKKRWILRLLRARSHFLTPFLGNIHLSLQINKDKSIREVLTLACRNISAYKQNLMRSIKNSLVWIRNWTTIEKKAKSTW